MLFHAETPRPPRGTPLHSPCVAQVTISSAIYHFTPLYKFPLCRTPPPLVQGEGIDSIIRLLFLGTHAAWLDP